jgi:hypothetical protein
MSQNIENDPNLVEDNELYVKNDGTYISRFKGAIHNGSLLHGNFSNPAIVFPNTGNPAEDLKELSQKLASDLNFQKQIFEVTSQREHTTTKNLEYNYETNEQRACRNKIIYSPGTGSYTINGEYVEQAKAVEIAGSPRDSWTRRHGLFFAYSNTPFKSRAEVEFEREMEWMRMK